MLSSFGRLQQLLVLQGSRDVKCPSKVKTHFSSFLLRTPTMG